MGMKNIKIVFVHIYIKSGSIYVKPRPKLSLAHSTHIVRHISSVKMLYSVIICSYSREPHITAATWPCSYLFTVKIVQNH